VSPRCRGSLARLQPLRALKRTASARTIAAGHAFVQNLRRGHYAITANVPIHDRVRVAFDELALCLFTTATTRPRTGPGTLDLQQRNTAPAHPSTGTPLTSSPPTSPAPPAKPTGAALVTSAAPQQVRGSADHQQSTSD
jgi:hypothetical protein